MNSIILVSVVNSQLRIFSFLVGVDVYFLSSNVHSSTDELRCFLRLVFISSFGNSAASMNDSTILEKRKFSGFSSC